MSIAADQFQLLVLILVAIGVGWFLGRYQYRTRLKGKAIKPSGGLKGARSPLRLLVDSYSDNALDEMLAGLEVNTKTLPIHLSIGRHFRQEGEVDRAILIHQNLLAHPQLSSEQVNVVTFELAKDYKSAGLFDRAETLLEELVFSRGLSDQSRRLLLSILERQKDWQHAADLISKWDCRRDSELAKRMTHYHCEIAKGALDSGRYVAAKSHLAYANKVDDENPRVLLLLAQLSFAEKSPEKAISYLRTLIEKHTVYASLALELLATCSESNNSRDKMFRFLERVYRETKSESVLLMLVNELLILARKGEARVLLEEHIDLYPSARSLEVYAKLFVASSYTDPKITRLTDAVIEAGQAMPGFRCDDCGFVGGFHWQCPSCFHWESIKPVANV
jgi:lipopolysaccharide biosynthesis regulator YciM